MPLPVSATSFLPNPLVQVDARRAGFELGTKSSGFANFVTGAFQGAETTLGLIDRVQQIEARPREEARREREADLREERFELEKRREERSADQFDRRLDLDERKFETDTGFESEKINLRRKELAIRASTAAVNNRKAAREAGIENSIVQLEQGNPDSLLAEFQQDAGLTGRLLLDNSKGSKERRRRAQSAISSFMQSGNGTELQRERLRQVSENLEDQRFLIDNQEKTAAAFAALDTSNIPAAVDQLVLVERSELKGSALKDSTGEFQDVLRVFDQDGKQTFSISEETLRKRGVQDERIESIMGAGQRIQEYQRRQRKAIEKPLKQLADAKARQSGQPLQEERPAQEPRQRQRLQGSGVTPAPTPAAARQRSQGGETRQERVQRLSAAEREQGSIRSPQSKKGEQQLREIAGLADESAGPQLSQETIQGPLL